MFTISWAPIEFIFVWNVSNSDPILNPKTLSLTIPNNARKGQILTFCRKNKYILISFENKLSTKDVIQERHTS